MANSALDIAAKSVSFNIILQVSLFTNKCKTTPLFKQVLLRISSFILNGFVLRFISAELLGIVNLR